MKSVRGHFTLLALATAVWAAFWLAGLPDYYQQYSTVTMAVVCIVLGVAVSLGAVSILLRVHPDSRLGHATWISFYFTVPLAILDWLYCGVHLGHGAAFLGRYWYVTVFYFTPWLTLVPTALLLRRATVRPRTMIEGD